MARFMATATGRAAKRASRLGSTNHPAKGTAQTWTVAATAEAYACRHAKPDAPPAEADRLTLALEALCQGCSRGHQSGKTLTIWDGSAAEAEALLGHAGPKAQAAALRKAAANLQAKARQVLSADAWAYQSGLLAESRAKRAAALGATA